MNERIQAIQAIHLMIGDDIIIMGQRLTVIRTYQPHNALTEFITNDGITRKFPSSYFLDRIL